MTKLHNAFTTTCAACILGLTLVAPSALAQTAGSGSTGPTRTLTGKGHKAERHPEIRMALRRLNGSLEAMRNAADDFGGHKEKAMDLVSQAIAELKEALKVDKR